jgi:hypothetical protein
MEEFVEVIRKMVDRTCSSGERQQRYIESPELSWSKDQVK